MPRIPVRTEGVVPGQVSLGRQTAAELPGVGEQVFLRQLTEVVEKGAPIAQGLLARQEAREKEKNDLEINEGKLDFMQQSRQLLQDLQQTRPQDAPGVFNSGKKGQDKIYKQVTANMNPDVIERFDQVIASYATEFNVSTAKLQAGLEKQRILDNFEGSKQMSTINAMDNFGNDDRFKKYRDEALVANSELQRLNGVGEKQREADGIKLKSSLTSDRIRLMSGISLPNARRLLDQALEDGDLTSPDSFKLSAFLNKAQVGAEKKAVLAEMQPAVDDLWDKHNGQVGPIFKELEQTYSGEKEKVGKELTRSKEGQESLQRSQNQVQFGFKMKSIVDDSPNKTEGKINLEDFISRSPTMTISTANNGRSYLENKYKVTPRTVSDPLAVNEAYVLIDKNRQGTADPAKGEIIENAEQLTVMFSPRTTPGDMKKILDYHRNGGLFNKTGYETMLQSFADIKGVSRADLRQDEDDMKKFNEFLDFVIPRLPSDKAINPLDLSKLTSAFMLQGSEGETLIPGSSIFETGLFDDIADETYEEAEERGEGIFWLPDLDEEKDKMAADMLAKENEERSKAGAPLFEDSEKNRKIIYKNRVMLLPYQERGQ
jgi:hypothetical protein